MMNEGRIKVEHAEEVPVFRALTIAIGQGAIDIIHGLLIRVGFNHHLEGYAQNTDMYPFLSTTTAQIVYLHVDTEVIPKNIKVVVE